MNPKGATQRRSTEAVDQMDDAELVRMIAEGDPAAMSVAYKQHAAKVNAVAFSIVRDRDLAADVTQDVFERLWHRSDRFDPDRGSIRAFLTVDAQGRSIDLVRSRNATKKREINDHARRVSDAPLDTEDEALRRIEASVVRSGLESLPEEQRVPITLAYFDGLPYRLVAERLRMPEGTVKSRIRAGLATLGSTLSDAPSVV